MTLPPTPLEALLASLIGEVTSRTLQLDPTSYPRLEAIAGTRIRFEVIPPALPGVPEGDARTLLLTVHPDALDLRAGADGEAHAVVRGTLPDIARSLLGQDPDADTTAGVRVEGDGAALQAVAALFRDLEPDLAEPLSALLGRDMADNVIGAAEAGLAFLKSAAESMTAGLRQEARSNWVDDDAFRQLMDRTEDLGLRVDRLAARVRLAEERTEQPDRDGDSP